MKRQRPLSVPVADFSEQAVRVARSDVIEVYGRVEKVVGLVIESSGPNARIGDLCHVHSKGSVVPAEVVGFRGNNLLLMPYGELSGIEAGSQVRATGGCHHVPTGKGLLGRILDGLGRPVDGRGPLKFECMRPILNAPPCPLERRLINKPISLGIRAIDAVLTVGVGQRLGIFSGSGVGKSSLLGMVARNALADVNVIALVGERGREVREFIENDLGEEGLKRSVLIVATSEQPALTRIKAAFTATAIAEAFRDEGHDALLLMDSITRFAMAQREVGLAIGEPPSTKAYTPSVFAVLPRLMERAGTSDKGSITAIYTVLVEGDDTSEPVADTARSVLDGHIVLSRKLAQAGHYPAIDILASISRVMPSIVTEKHMRAANRLRELVAAYRDVEDLVAIGAYKPGAKPDADLAIGKWERINQFLRQNVSEKATFDDAASTLMELTNA